MGVSLLRLLLALALYKSQAAPSPICSAARAPLSAASIVDELGIVAASVAPAVFS